MDVADRAGVDRYFKDCASTLDAIMVKADQGPATRILATYEALARYRIRDSVGARSALQRTLATDRPRKKSRINLDDDFAPRGATSTPRTPDKSSYSEDELFTRALIAVVSDEADEQ